MEIRDVGELGDVEATNGRIEAAIATGLDAELVAESTTGSVSASGYP